MDDSTSHEILDLLRKIDSRLSRVLEWQTEHGRQLGRIEAGLARTGIMIVTAHCGRSQARKGGRG